MLNTNYFKLNYYNTMKSEDWLSLYIDWQRVENEETAEATLNNYRLLH